MVDSKSKIIIRNHPISRSFFVFTGLLTAIPLVFTGGHPEELIKGSEGPGEIITFKSSTLISSIMHVSSLFLEDSNSFCSFARVLSRKSSKLFFESLSSQRSLKVSSFHIIEGRHQNGEIFTWRTVENMHQRNIDFEYLKYWQSALRGQSFLDPYRDVKSKDVLLDQISKPYRLSKLHEWI